MTATTTLTDDQQSTIAFALRIAAERYKQDAAQVGEVPGHQRLADQFKDQEAKALALAELLEGGEPITINGAPVDIDNVELAAITTGLRLIQRSGVPAALEPTATNSGEHDVLGDDEIDDLCERLNCA